MSRSALRSKRALGLWFLLVSVALCSGATAGAAAKCSSRKTSCTTTGDTSPPVVSITAPSSGATVAASVTVNGPSSDNASVAKVEVKVDAGAYAPASGTTNWSYALNTTSYADGAHTITARATDASGNVSTASASVTVSNSSSSSGPTTIANADAGNDLVLLGRGRMATSGNVTSLLYTPRMSFSPWAYFRDAGTGANSSVLLPVGQATGPSWSTATYALNGLSELWVYSGGGPTYARQYRLSGSPLPTSATLLSITSFGDADSRAEDLALLASGGIVAVWHQQGNAGPQYQGIAYRSPAGAWSSTTLTYMPTKAASQAVAQNPADGSILVFCDADGWGQIGAAHLTEGQSGLHVDWTDGGFISPERDGNYGPDPENPDLEASPDASTGTVALAYESNVRQIFSTSPFVAGSYPAVTRIAANGSRSYLSMPTYVERVSRVGLTVRAGETWLSYRPIASDLSSNDLYTSVYRNGGWSSGMRLGTLADVTSSGFGAGRAEFAARTTDGKLSFFPAA